MEVIINILLFWLFATCLVLGKTSRVLTLSELRRRARANSGGKYAKVYSVATYSAGFKLLIWLFGSLAFFGLILRLANTWPTLFVLIIGSGLVLLAWHPKKGQAWYWSYFALLAPILVKPLSLIEPLAKRLERLLEKFWPVDVHAGIYESEDLMKIIKNQKDQSENRIPETDLRMAYGALAFGDKLVREVMTPRRQMKIVTEKDDIGPHLLDELHASGFSRFPVVSTLTKSASIEVTGTLYLRDLIGHGAGGFVKDFMVRDVCFINEAATLRQALDGFIKTRHHLLVVVNNFEEVVGVITIEDVVEQIFGTKVLDEFDQYEDLREVAAADAAKDRKKHEEIETPEQSDETVVE